MAGRVFAIGDVHGCAAELDTLLGGLGLGAGDTVVCVGDYLDRGPDSRGVIDVLLALRARDDLTTTFLKGNHEDMCLGWLGLGGRHGDVWMANGGAIALASYGLTRSQAPDDVRAALPPAHLAFLTGLEPYRTDGGHLFVHAGVRPARPLAQQVEEDLFWIRGEFVHHAHGLPWTVVFGHTPVREVLVDLPEKIGIDTGCVYGGRLTALELPARVVHQVARGERSVRSGRLAPARRAR